MKKLGNMAYPSSQNRNRTKQGPQHPKIKKNRRTKAPTAEKRNIKSPKENEYSN